MLAEIRGRGFALNDEETVLGLRSVAAAIKGHQNSPVAALNVALPADAVVNDDGSISVPLTRITELPSEGLRKE